MISIKKIIKDLLYQSKHNIKFFVFFLWSRYTITSQLKIKKLFDLLRLGLMINYGIQILDKPTEKIPLSSSISYYKWLRKNYAKKSDIEQIKAHLSGLTYQPKISIIVPVFNPNKKYLQQAIESVVAQIYSNWELCIADDASTQSETREIIENYCQKDHRIKSIFRESNGNISACSNSALSLATGEFIALLDHDDILTLDALYHIVVSLNDNPSADMLYSDEDKINEYGHLEQPFFKPDWCPDSFLSRMYICHLGVYRRDLVEKIGGFRVGYEGSQDYDLVLRLSEQTNKIIHIPKVLYHWRIHKQSTSKSLDAKSYTSLATKRAITDALQRRGECGEVITNSHGNQIIRYQITEYKKVSIIVPTRNLGKILNTCLQSIFQKTEYPNYEVLVIDNGSTEIETKKVINYWQTQEITRFKCLPLDIPFNFSKINNYAVQHCEGQYLLFLNNDTEVITPDWINAMVEQAQRPSIGAVGALLLYPDNTIQHAGVLMGFGGVAGHSHQYYPVNSLGYFDQIHTINNYSAVTGACLLCRREVFEEIGGFEEELSIAFNDVDLCLKMLDNGYQNIYLPHVKLYHYESKSRGYETTIEKQERFTKEVKFMIDKWDKYIQHDPCYSIHLRP